MEATDLPYFCQRHKSAADGFNGSSEEHKREEMMQVIIFWFEMRSSSVFCINYTFHAGYEYPYPGVEKEFFPWGENMAVATDIGDAISYS